MANVDQTLNELLEIDGAMACMLVDYTSGLILGSAGSGIDLDIAAAGNTQVVKAKMHTMKNLGISGGIEDILITLNDHYHIIRPTESQEGLFMYLVLNKEKANLGMARLKIKNAEKALEI